MAEVLSGFCCLDPYKASIPGLSKALFVDFFLDPVNGAEGLINCIAVFFLTDKLNFILTVISICLK